MWRNFYQLAGWLTLVLFLVILGLFYGGSWLLLQAIKESKEAELGRRLLSIGQTISTLTEEKYYFLDPELMDNYKDSPEFGELKKVLNKISMANKLQGIMVIDRDNKVFVDPSGKWETGQVHPFLEIDKSEIDAAFSGTATTSVFYRIQDFPYKRAYVPLSGPDGTPVSVLRLEASREYLHDLLILRQHFYWVLGVITAILVILALIFYSFIRRLIKAEQAMVRSERLQSLGMLAAGIAHEIRNPLGIIRATAECLKEEAQQAEQQNFAHDIVQESDRLNDLITQFLQLAGPKPPKEYEPAEVSESLQYVVNLMQSGLEKKSIKVVHSLPEDCPELGIPDNYLKQVLFNILLNSMEAMADGGEIEISGSIHRKSFYLNITDSGSGIDKKNLRYIFDPFYSTKVTGTGLGLSVTREILQTFDADIKIQSEKNRGTKVTLILPLANKDKAKNEG